MSGDSDTLAVLPSANLREREYSAPGLTVFHMLPTTQVCGLHNCINEMYVHTMKEFIQLLLIVTCRCIRLRSNISF